jgi:hypothetical protein
MRRYAIAVALGGIVLALLSTLPDRPAQAQADSCSSCTPLRLNRFDDVPGSLDLCFVDGTGEGHTWSSGQMDAVKMEPHHGHPS